MKRIVSMILLLAMVMCLAGAAGAADFTVEVGAEKTSLAPGEELEILVSLSGAENSTAASVAVTLSDGLELVSGELLATSALMKNFDVNNKVGVVAFAGASDVNGDYAKLTVKATDEAAGSQAVTVKVDLRPSSASSSGTLNLTITHTHVPGDPVRENEVPASCAEEGSYDEVVYCTVCNEEISRETKTIEKLPHTPGKPVRENETEPDCDKDGGYDEVVYCTVCGEEISRDTTTIPALDHDWGEPSYEWAPDYSAVTARRVCGRNAKHEETERAITTAEVTKEATFEERGETTYTATFENEAFETQTKTVANIPTLDKEWGAPSYEWAEDYSSVTATRTLLNGDESQTETVETTAEVTKAATCEEMGETTYTATFKNEAFQTQVKTVENLDPIGHDWDEGTVTTEPGCTEKGVKTFTCKHDANHTRTEDVEPIGHDWGEVTYEWAEDNSSVTASRTCKHDASHVESETAYTTSEVTREATDEDEGETTYTATFENEAFETQTKAVAGVHEPVGPVGPRPGGGGGGGFSKPGKKDDAKDETKEEENTQPETQEPEETVENPFLDVKESDWFYDAVLWALKEEVTTGLTEETFAPDGTCTRAQFVTFLWRSQGKPAATKAAQFEDVAANAWYSEAIAWAAENGIVKGYGATFGVNDTVTREQIVTILWRMAGKPAAEAVDTGASDWAPEAMSWAVSKGLIAGDGTGYQAQGTATRAQVVTFLKRFAEL